MSLIWRSSIGARPGVQPAHDPVGHGEDEGVPGGSGNATRPHVPHRQGLPDLARPQAHVATEHGGQTQRGKDPFTLNQCKIPANMNGSSNLLESPYQNGFVFSALVKCE